MDYQYKIIVSNRTVYKEFEIAAGVENVRLGTTSSCEFRLNPETFFQRSRLSFRYIAINGIWTVRINCILAEVTCGNIFHGDQPWRYDISLLFEYRERSV